MAYYNEDQLSRYFTAAMTNVANKKIEQLKDEIHQIYKREMTKIKDELNVKHTLERQEALREINVAHQEKLNLIGIEYNAELIRARDEMAQTIFESVLSQLKAFMKTKKYVTLMSKKIDQLQSNYPTRTLSFSLNPKDIVLRDIILERFSKDTEIFSDHSIVIGGFIATLKDERIEYDETFDAKLQKARETFIQTSKLFIRT